MSVAVGNSHRTEADDPLDNWWYCLGATVGLLLVVQALSGIVLAVHYEPDASRGYEAVRRISDHLPYGWYFRSLHRWSASALFAVVALHGIRVFFTSAYRDGRHPIWVVGWLLFAVMMAMGLTGYGMLGDQHAYWSITAAANLLAHVPWLGQPLAELTLGGPNLSTVTVQRLFVGHVVVGPLLLGALSWHHLGMVRSRGLYQQRAWRLTRAHLHTVAIIGLTVLVGLNVLVTLFPASLGPAADPLNPVPAEPAWFLLAPLRWVKIQSASSAAVTASLLLITVLFWPVIDRWLGRRASRRSLSTVCGAVAVVAFIGLTVWEALAIQLAGHPMP